jgi:hypothetical protein
MSIKEALDRHAKEEDKKLNGAEQTTASFRKPLERKIYEQKVLGKGIDASGIRSSRYDYRVT